MDRLHEIDKQFQDMVKEQRYSDDISSYNAALLIMAGLLIVTVLLLFIMTGYNTKLLLVVLVMLVMFSSYRIGMYKAAQNLEQYEMAAKTSGVSYDKETVSQKLNYLSAALDLKMTRVKSVRRFYIFTFPLFLLCLRELLQGPASTVFLIGSLIATLIVSYAVWTSFFSSDLSDLERQKIITAQLLKETNLA